MQGGVRMTGARQAATTRAGGHFTPDDEVVDNAGWAGQRRDVVIAAPVPLRWPKERGEQQNLFTTWHACTARVLHAGNHSYRLLAAVPIFLNWSKGKLWPSNSTLARCLGGCSEKTIQREVNLYRSLGVIDVQEVSVKGQRYRNRVISLTFPADIGGDFFVPDDELQMDTSGPPDWLDQMDTSGPDQMDNSGPPNLEENLEYKKHGRST